jgi:hypothetical protein
MQRALCTKKYAFVHRGQHRVEVLRDLGVQVARNPEALLYLRNNSVEMLVRSEALPLSVHLHLRIQLSAIAELLLIAMGNWSG